MISEYFNLFSRRTANAGIKKVNHNGVRFLANYRGADAFKHGYTTASGYNAVASAQRGNSRIITVMFVEDQLQRVTGKWQS